MTERQYSVAGVDLETAEDAKTRIGRMVAATRTGLSLGDVGAFGGMVRVPAGYRSPVLVMSTDGVGTKVLVALAAGRFDTVGEDLVNHSVNDILVHGARPIAFQDYIAGSGLTAERIASVVEGVARGCRHHQMALTGGETAMMPGLYEAGHFDLAGTILGVVEEDQAIHGDRVVPGDALLAYASSGLHTNGYTLARRIVFDAMKLSLDSTIPGTEQTVADGLLAVHRSYASAVMPIVSRVHAIAHITGGGIPGNLVRVLPDRCEAVVEGRSWTVPPLFQVLQQQGKVALDEMREVFNLGVGLIVVLAPGDVDAARTAAHAAGVETWPLGEVRRGERGVRFSP